MIATGMSGPRRWLVVLVLCLLPATAAAERVLVLPASGAGVSSHIIQSTRALFVSRLARQNTGLVIIDHERPPTARLPELPEVVALALAAQASAAILVDLRRAEGGTTLEVTGLGVPHGERLFQYRHTTSSGPEIIPALVDSAVASALTKQGAAAPVVDRPPAPRMLFLGARVGLQVPRETPGAIQAALPGAGLFVTGELSRIFVDVGFSHASAERGDSEDRGHSTGFGLGVFLPFSMEPTAPYLGATLRWQWSRYGGEGAQGFVVTPTVGWSWRRKQSLGFRAEAGVFYNTYRERSVDRLVPNAGQLYRSYGLEVWVATWL